MYALPCPRGCEDTILHKDLETHQDTCPLEPVHCPLQELGCEAEICRKDLTQHTETNAIQHLSMLAKSHMTLTKELTVLKSDHKALSEKHSGLVQDYATLKCFLSTTVVAPTHPSSTVSPYLYLASFPCYTRPPRPQ
jgi:hypothetical protein